MNQELVQQGGLKESVSKNLKIIYDGWEKIVYGFKNGKLPLS